MGLHITEFRNAHQRRLHFVFPGSCSRREAPRSARTIDHSRADVTSMARSGVNCRRPFR
jgi:hypothetical protein